MCDTSLGWLVGCSVAWLAGFRAGCERRVGVSGSHPRQRCLRAERSTLTSICCHRPLQLGVAYCHYGWLAFFGVGTPFWVVPKEEQEETKAHVGGPSPRKRQTISQTSGPMQLSLCLADVHGKRLKQHISALEVSISLLLQGHFNLQI